MKHANTYYNKMNYSDDIVERFWSKINYSDDTNICWEWKYTCARYPLFWVIDRNITAHKFSYQSFNGIIEDNNLYVCHTCDNIKCVNPHHLYLGTHQQNVNDMVNRLRYTKGEDSHLSKVTDDQIIEILYNISIEKYQTYEDIEDEYPFTRKSLEKLLNRKSWKHITNYYSDYDLLILKAKIYKGKRFKILLNNILKCVE